MRTLKYIFLGVILSSLVFSSFSINPSRKRMIQPGTVTFCETYTQQEVLSNLDSDDRIFKLVDMENSDPKSSRIGFSNKADFRNLWNHLDSEAFRAQVPGDLLIAAGTESTGERIPVYAIRKSATIDALPLQEEVEKVGISKSASEENYSLMLTFSQAGADKWADLTRANTGRDIAILFDGKVISAPRVREEIKGGQCMLSGKFTEREIQQLKAFFEN